MRRRRCDASDELEGLYDNFCREVPYFALEQRIRPPCFNFPAEDFAGLPFVFQSGRHACNLSFGLCFLKLAILTSETDLT